MTASEYPTGQLRTRSGRKAIVPLWVLEAKVLTPGEFAIYVALISFADHDTGECFPTARRLAEITRQAIGSCRNAVQKFCKLDLIESTPQYRADGGQRGNLYVLAEVPPPPIAIALEAYRAELRAQRETEAGAQAPTPDSAGGVHQTVQGATPPDVANRTNHENYPDEQPKSKTPSSGTVGARRTVRNARGRTGAASPRVEDSSPSPAADRRPGPSEAAWSALAGMPRQWRDGCPPWLRKAMAGRLDKAMTVHGYGAAAIASAVTRYAPEPAATAAVTVDGPDADPNTKHLDALERVLTLLAADVKGGACRSCGDDRVDEAGVHKCGGPPPLVLVPGVCASCDTTDDVTARPEAGGMYACDGCWATVTAVVGSGVGHAA